MDRDKSYAELFRALLKGSGIEPVWLPLNSPNLNTHIERFMRSLKEECLERLVLFGEKSLPSAISEFIVHYQRERNHQGMQNRLIQPGAEAAGLQGEIACRNRLGGMIQYYYRKAA
jgi:putative transposase